MRHDRLRSWREDGAAFWALTAPPVLWLVAFFVVPLAMVWLVSFAGRGPQGQVLPVATLENYARALEPIHLLIIAKSVAIAVAVTAICVVIGVAMALVIAFAPTRWKNPLLLLVMLPFWTNLLIRTYSWIALLRSEGLVNLGSGWLHEAADALLGLVGLDGLMPAFQPVELLYSTSAVILSLIHIHLPFVVLPAYAALERIDRDCLESSLDLGATPAQTFRLVMLPMAMPGIATGALIAFILALGSFVAADLLGGTDSIMIGNLIQRQFTASNDWQFGAALSFLLLYVTFALVWLNAARRARVPS
ncbi:MAG: ABC transporter permease [Alphaproteobacteria bacterium]|nr:ABC transporter permease [Alphaproteobacteria bacterium]